MNYRLVGIVAVLAASAPAVAGQKYDVKIEQAAARIVAARIGDIRGGFGPGERPVFLRFDRQPVERVDVGQPPAPGGGWVDGLAPARDAGSASFAPD